MKKQYTKDQIKNKISKLRKMLKESEACDAKGKKQVDEKVSNIFKTKRSTEDAIDLAKKAGLEAGDPMIQLVERHKEAKAAAQKACRNELKSGKDKNASEMEAIKFSNNCIKDGNWVHSKTGYLVIGAYLYAKEKKGFLKRLMSGSMGNWFQNVGVVALREYVRVFLGKSFANQVTAKTVFDSVGDENSKYPGRTGFYVAFKFNSKGQDLEESKKLTFTK